MFSHIMIGTNDLERSRRFYDEVLGLLGAGAAFRHVASSGHARLFYRYDGNTLGITEPINGEPATPANGATIGLKCHSEVQVHAFHAVALAHGGSAIEEPPGLRESSMGPMHLAYVRDPDGNKLCAIFRAR